MWLAALPLLTATALGRVPDVADDLDVSGPIEGLEILGGDGIPSLVEPTTEVGNGIVNGTVDVGNTHDNVVLLAWWDGSYYFFPFCSGTVIDDRWVVTAAHCLESVEDEEDYLSAYGFDFYIFMGSGSNGSYTDAVLVSDYVINPTYNAQQFINDIGLVETTRNLGVSPMVLNDEAIGQSWVGDEMIFVGYGITTDDGTDGGTKRYADIPIVDWDSWNVYSYEPTQNVCQGDSGGASLEQTADGYELAGINAFVSPGCVGGSNGSTRVDLFIGWIQGFVPNALVGPDDTPPPPSDTDTDVDADSDVDVDVDTDSDADNELGVADQEPEWDSPSRPKKGQYPVRLRCATGPGAPASGGLVLGLGLLALGRRRRSDSSIPE